MAQGITQTISVEAVSGAKAFKARFDVSETYDINSNTSDLSFDNLQVSLVGFSNGVMYVYGKIELVKDGEVIATLFNASSSSGNYPAYREGTNWDTLTWSEAVNGTEHNDDGTLTVTIRFNGFGANSATLGVIPGPINNEISVTLTPIARGIVYIDDGNNTRYKAYIDDGEWHEYIPMIDTGTWERY